MPRLEPVSDGDGNLIGYMFQCPGCGEYHMFTTAGKNSVGATWTFNGDVERPTFSPSLLVQSGHYAPGHKPGERCWCTYNEEHPDKPAPYHCYRCHSFVRDGRIQFLADCTHELAGKTVPLPDIV